MLDAELLRGLSALIETFDVSVVPQVRGALLLLSGARDLPMVGLRLMYDRYGWLRSTRGIQPRHRLTRLLLSTATGDAVSTKGSSWFGMMGRSPRRWSKPSNGGSGSNTAPTV